MIIVHSRKAGKRCGKRLDVDRFSVICGSCAVLEFRERQD